MSSLEVSSQECKPCLALRTREAAGALGISQRLLQSLTADKHIPFFKLGSANLYPVKHLEQWLDDRVVASGAIEFKPMGNGGRA